MMLDKLKRKYHILVVVRVFSLGTINVKNNKNPLVFEIFESKAIIQNHFKCSLFSPDLLLEAPDEMFHKLQSFSDFNNNRAV